MCKSDCPLHMTESRILILVGCNKDSDKFQDLKEKNEMETFIVTQENILKVSAVWFGSVLCVEAILGQLAMGWHR